jgi:hypothetical protein
MIPLAERHIVAVVAVAFGLTGAAGAVAQPAPVAQCVVADSRLAELSGLAADGQLRYAVADGGRRLQVVVLRRDCTVQRVITAAVDPFDVEDLALALDGTLWLADIGDNDRRRQTIALHELTPAGATRLHRLTYPDGPHDAEALLLDRQGRPHVITKETLGGSGVYRAVGPLATPGPSALERVATVSLARTNTTGGPAGSIGSMLITGGASTADGNVVALRTYTDAYLFPVAGDLVTALRQQPVRIPLPGEPQGEAIAFEPDGTLLSASERAGAGPQPIRAIAEAAALVTASVPTPTGGSGTDEPATADDQPRDNPLPHWHAAALGLAGAAAVLFLISRIGARRRR